MSPSFNLRETREFAREIKFLIPPSMAEQIGDWAGTRLSPDPNADGGGDSSYGISSLYFDTAQFDVFHRRGSFGRSKYRIRRYGESDRVFLERKLKTRGLLTKRRSLLAMEELPLLGNGGAGSGWAACWFYRRLQARRLRPVCQISYRRSARVAMTEYGPIRLTLDYGLSAAPVNGLAFHESSTGATFLSDRVVLELKYRCDLPSMFKDLLAEFGLAPEPVSKYRLASAFLGLVPATDAGALEKVAEKSEGKAILRSGGNFAAVTAF